MGTQETIPRRFLLNTKSGMVVTYDEQTALKLGMTEVDKRGNNIGGQKVEAVTVDPWKPDVVLEDVAPSDAPDVEEPTNGEQKALSRMSKVELVGFIVSNHADAGYNENELLAVSNKTEIYDIAKNLDSEGK